jgi:hypothetical protein
MCIECKEDETAHGARSHLHNYVRGHTNTRTFVTRTCTRDVNLIPCTVLHCCTVWAFSVCHADTYTHTHIRMPAYSRMWSFALIVLLALSGAVSAFCPLVLVSQAVREHKRAYTFADIQAHTRVCVHTYVHTYIHTYIHHTCTYIHTYVRTYIRTSYIYAYIL